MEEFKYSPVGVIGSGSFGTAIASLLAENTDVLLYSRRPELVEEINSTRMHLGYALSPRITAVASPKALAEQCTLLFPMVASDAFKPMLQTFAPYLYPWHLMIHGTKGLDLTNKKLEDLDRKSTLSRGQIKTMSELILAETSVVRVGCLSGPNLATEIMAGQPTATLIASRYKEVIEAGTNVLNSKRFHVFGSPEIMGAEMAGAFKNIMALASGILGGLGMGRNLQAMLITRGLSEMVHLGMALGAGKSAFMGTAGIGDLVATATSTSSRNYAFGMRLGKGEKTEDIVKSLTEVAEGVRTLKIAYKLARHYKVHVPIMQMMYGVVFEDFPLEKGMEYLIEFPYSVDVDFI